LPTQPKKRRQARGLRTELKVLEAAEQLMKDRGFDAAQVNNIVELSGVSIGSFYHHFGSKEGVIGRIVDNFCETGRERIANLELEGQSPREVLETILSSTIAQFRMNPELYRNMAARVEKEPEMWQPMRDLRFHYEDVVFENLRPRLPEYSDQELRRSIQATLQTVIAILTHSVLFASGPINLETPGADERLLNIAYAVLQSELNDNKKEAKNV